MKFLKRSDYPEIICFLVFCFCTIFISFFHEPWRDEFQSWQISKEALNSILFTIPHFEGHCPIWYLILKCFSYFNINAEIGLKIPNLLIMFSAVWLLIFKSPFKRIVKLSLPFTYFLFYQYSVISRPYSLFCLGIFLSALFYEKRNLHPFKFVSALILAGFSGAYAMVITTGIIIVWFIEIIKEGKLNFLKDKRICAMFLTAFVYLIIFIACLPDKNVFSGAFEPNIIQFLYLTFGLPLDSLIMNITYYSPKISLLIIFFGIILYFILFYIFKASKALMLFFIPFLLFLTVADFVYFCGHHMGILTVFYIFVFWVKKLPDKKIFSILLSIPIIVQIFWSICAYKNEYNLDYSYSRKLSHLIKENNYEKYNIMNYFSRYNYNFQYVPITVLPYFKENIFYNNPNNYLLWKNMTDEEKNEADKKLKAKGYPDIIIADLEFAAIHIQEYDNEILNAINEAFLSQVFEKDKNELPKYKIVKVINYSHIWKNGKFGYIMPVFEKDKI